MANYNKESAQFILRSNDLPLTIGTNSIGSMLNSYRTSMIWRNVDLKTIMGPLYDKYDLFTISLVTGMLSSYAGNPSNAVAYLNPVTTITTNTTTVNKSTLLTLSGLSFRNSTYSLFTKSNLQYVNIGMMNLVGANIGTVISNFSNSNITFSKTVPIVDLSIQFRTIYNDSIMNALSMGMTAGDGYLPHYQLIFRIDPIIE
jgi:hypothetical protein